MEERAIPFEGVMRASSFAGARKFRRGGGAFVCVPRVTLKLDPAPSLSRGSLLCRRCRALEPMREITSERESWGNSGRAKREIRDRGVVGLSCSGSGSLEASCACDGDVVKLDDGNVDRLVDDGDDGALEVIDGWMLLWCSAGFAAG